MTIEQIKEKINSNEYDFLRDNIHLGDKICLLGLGGSYAYGTNNENSDLDIRGFALNSKEEILTNENFEQVTNEKTDTTIYSFNKLISLLSNCNPNVIEMLGLKEEHYLYKNEIGQLLIDNANLFLSKKAIQSFGGYATAQLRRLDNKSARVLGQEQRENHILNSIKNASVDFKRQYLEYDEDNIKLYVDKAVNEELDSEIFMDIHLTHYPLRDYKSMWSSMNNIVKDYAKFGSRNKKALEHGKLGKHMMHLVRLFYMCFDILENNKIVTYRENEHDLLMDIRNGMYLDSNNQPIPEFYKMLDELERRFEYAKLNTNLPDKPDYNRIKELMIYINEKIVRGEF